MHKILVIRVILIIAFCYFDDFLFAQYERFFPEKTDDNYSKILISVSELGKDTASYTENYVFEFDNQGRIIKESQPEYYIEISYKYDKQNRLIEKEEFYGESFANGVTIYSYDKNKLIEKKTTAGYCSKSTTLYDDLGNILNIVTYSIETGLGETYFKKQLFQYKKGKIKKKLTETKYYDYKKNPSEYDSLNFEIIYKELEQSLLIKEENEYELYNYNDKNQLISINNYDKQTDKQNSQLNYSYNEKGKITFEEKRCLLDDEKSFNEYLILKEYFNGTISKITEKNRHSTNIYHYEEGKLLRDEVMTSGNEPSYHTYKYKFIPH